MKRLKAAPDLRNKDHTADSIISVINTAFGKKDRNALKVHFLQLFAGKTAHESIHYLGLERRKLNTYPLEVEHKRATNIVYAMYYWEIYGSFSIEIRQGIRRDYVKHQSQIQKRLSCS
jgi:hypothetical protein